MKLHELFESIEKSFKESFTDLEDPHRSSILVQRDKLTSLEGAPKHVDGDFDCNRNLLKSLKGAPKHVGGVFNCAFNDISSLEGAPSFIGEDFNCSNNKQLTSLHNIHKQIKHIGRGAYFDGCPITSHVLGFLLIDGLTSVVLENLNVQIIINTHLYDDRDVFACQEELIEKGFEEYAQL